MKKCFIAIVFLLCCFFLQAQNAGNSTIAIEDSMSLQEAYEFYKNRFERATTTRNAGIGITTAGLGLTTIGLFAIGSSQTWDGAIIGGYIFLIGGVTTLIGVPVWITGSVKRKNISKALKELQEKLSVPIGRTRLYLGPAGDGVGLTLKF